MTTAEIERPVVYTTRGVAELLGVTPMEVRTAEMRKHIPPAQRDLGTGDHWYREEDLPAIEAYFSGR